MARKKKQKDVIETTATINQITLNKTEHKISFSALKVKEGDSEFLQEIIDNESRIEVAVIYPGAADPNFPPIVCECGMKGFSIKKTVDTPAFINMRYTGDQIDRLRHIMEAESEITLKIKRLEGTFDFEGDEKED